ncbi:tail fiber domain-containing protein [Dyadobacter sp. CY261]|uniref:tail fiber domain-containing protein n=1 Tax=Dyadobacter sp. CY261 TaxID=2907203 RepID=UPI001F196826|nr:tail fiber domain-containing protein [Dyadobacter sp. CY261]MCF0070616.1 tail fiber domain-containing protein [Dyadobacter sp. CY261]
MQHKTTLLILICLGLILNIAHAQAPYKFTFQGLAVDDMAQPVQNASIQVKISIIQSQILGPIVFEETHTVQTNSNGMFTVVVGTGGGDLSQVRWPYDIFFLKAEVDVKNDGKFHFIGMSQLLSFPYSLYANESGKLRENFPILQKDQAQQSADLPTVGNGARLIWHPKKAAFRVGYTNGTWEDSNIGQSSFAAGDDAQSSGYGAVAIGGYSTSKGHRAFSLGYMTNADQQFSFAIGNGCYTYNPYSFAMGNWAAAMGDYSVSLGYHTVAKAPHSIAVGLYNNSFDQPNGGPTDRLFQIGNGFDINNRTNAMTVLRNGNVGIGGKAVAPEFVLDVASRMRIRNDGSTAGLYLNNSQNKPEGFMGMKTDKQVGFYINGAWQFWIDDAGHAWTSLGQLGFSSSDKRLKHNITPLLGSLEAISQMRGYHYSWIDTRRGTDLQTGVIAQEVEKYFPELVKQDEKGFKTVNYTGLIPHLIEAVSELKRQVTEIAGLRQELSELNAMARRIPGNRTPIQNSVRTK